MTNVNQEEIYIKHLRIMLFLRRKSLLDYFINLSNNTIVSYLSSCSVIVFNYYLKYSYTFKKYEFIINYKIIKK